MHTLKNAHIYALINAHLKHACAILVQIAGNVMKNWYRLSLSIITEKSNLSN